MTMYEPMIGISGWAGAGKDSVADLLEEKYGFKKMAFADPLREMAMAIDPIVEVETKNFYDGDPQTGELLGYEVQEVRYSGALERHGYNEAKFKYPEVRLFLQRLGTDAVRKVLGDDTWTNLAMQRAWGHMYEDGMLVGKVSLADTRFRNEADKIKSDGKGIVVRVVRPGVEAASDHISEHDLDGWKFDWVIQNDGTLEDLATRVDGMIAHFWPKLLGSH